MTTKFLKEEEEEEEEEEKHDRSALQSNLLEKVVAGPTKNRLFDENSPHSHPLAIGDIVAVPFIDEEGKKAFWLGKCMRKMEDSKVLLGWLKQVGDSDTYTLKLGASWEEVYIIMYKHTQRHTQRHMLHAHSHTHTFLPTYTLTHTYIYTHIIHTHIHIHIYVNKCVLVYECVGVVSMFV